MSYISQIKTPDGELYDVKDLEAIGYEGIIAPELDETGLAAQLKDKQGNKLYPVVDADNVITTFGTDLNTELSNMKADSKYMPNILFNCEDFASTYLLTSKTTTFGNVPYGAGVLREVASTNSAFELVSGEGLKPRANNTNVWAFPIYDRLFQVVDADNPITITFDTNQGIYSITYPTATTLTFNDSEFTFSMRNLTNETIQGISFLKENVQALTIRTRTVDTALRIRAIKAEYSPVFTGFSPTPYEEFLRSYYISNKHYLKEETYTKEEVDSKFVNDNLLFNSDFSIYSDETELKGWNLLYHNYPTIQFIPTTGLLIDNTDGVVKPTDLISQKIPNALIAGDSCTLTLIYGTLEDSTINSTTLSNLTFGQDATIIPNTYCYARLIDGQFILSWNDNDAGSNIIICQMKLEMGTESTSLEIEGKDPVIANLFKDVDEKITSLEDLIPDMVIEANGYTDTEVEASTTEVKEYSDTNLATAKSYTDTEVGDAVTEVKEYSDTNLATAKTYAESQASTALSSAKTYADNLPFSSMTAVTASSEANVGYTNATTDNKRVPTMSFMAYWNGRYNSSSSNLKYCNKGAFGDLATLSKNSSTANFLRGDGTWSNTLAGTFTVNGQLNVQNAKNFVCWSGSNSGNFVKIVTTASTENYNQIASNNNFNFCAGVHQFRNYGNTAWATVYASSFSQQSSIKYKKNVTEMTEEDAKKILELRPVTYDYINELDGTNCKGLIAEEVYEVQPWGVVFREEEVDGLDYSKFVPQLIKLCQIQQKEIDELKAKIEGGI